MTIYRLVGSRKLLFGRRLIGARQVACMQFINIVVHSTEDMNFRVHLQHEFTLLALDKYLDVSVFTVYTTFAKQVSQYMCNRSAREVPG